MTTESNRIAGQRAESAVEFMATRYQLAQKATLWRQGVQAVHTRQGWQPINSLPDFGGILWGSGRAIAFDVKATTQARYYHPKDREHQLRHLWQVHQAGGLAGLLIAYTDSSRYEHWWWAYPQPVWQDGLCLAIVMSHGSATKPVGAFPVPYWDGSVGGDRLPDFLNQMVIDVVVAL